MKKLLAVLLVLIVVAYPVVVYLGLKNFDARIVAGVLLVLFALRFFMVKKVKKEDLKQLLPICLAVAITSLLVILFNQSIYLKLNPFFINLVMLITFSATLKKGPSMIERFARIQEPDLPEKAIPYCRKVTIVWCGFFIINGSIALWTALFSSLERWTLYNGLISYILMGILFAVEFAVRLTQKKKHRS